MALAVRFVLLAVHSFNGRAYGGEQHVLAGPFFDQSSMDQWIEAVREHAARVSERVRISMGMQQQGVSCSTVLVHDSTSAPAEVLAAILEKSLDDVSFMATTQSSWQTGHLVLASVNTWNGRRFAGVSYALVGPFSHPEEAQAWVEAYDVLPEPPAHGLHKTIRALVYQDLILGSDVQAGRAFIDRMMTDLDEPSSA